MPCVLECREADELRGALRGRFDIMAVRGWGQRGSGVDGRCRARCAVLLVRGCSSGGE